MNAAYADLRDEMVDLPGREFRTDNIGRPLTTQDYLDILDQYNEEAGQVELSAYLIRALLTAQADEQRQLAQIALCADVLRQIKARLTERLDADVAEAIEDQEVAAHFVGNL